MTVFSFVQYYIQEIDSVVDRRVPSPYLVVVDGALPQLMPRSVWHRFTACCKNLQHALKRFVEPQIQLPRSIVHRS